MTYSRWQINHESVSKWRLNWSTKTVFCLTRFRINVTHRTEGREKNGSKSRQSFVEWFINCSIAFLTNKSIRFHWLRNGNFEIFFLFLGFFKFAIFAYIFVMHFTRALNKVQVITTGWFMLTTLLLFWHSLGVLLRIWSGCMSTQNILPFVLFAVCMEFFSRQTENSNFKRSLVWKTLHFWPKSLMSAKMNCFVAPTLNSMSEISKVKRNELTSFSFWWWQPIHSHQFHRSFCVPKCTRPNEQFQAAWIHKHKRKFSRHFSNKFPYGKNYWQKFFGFNLRGKRVRHDTDNVINLYIYHTNTHFLAFARARLLSLCTDTN